MPGIVSVVQAITNSFLAHELWLCCVCFLCVSYCPCSKEMECIKCIYLVFSACREFVLFSGSIGLRGASVSAPRLMVDDGAKQLFVSVCVCS